ncbi:MAG: rhomboid family intramembrane serine protease [Bacteroidota bacterium]
MQDEKRRIITSVSVFAIVVALMWVIKAIEMIAGLSFAQFGLLPLQLKGLPGILFAPLIHADVAHLAANSAPLFLLGAALIYYYRSDALRIFAFSWLLTGLWVWLFARGDNYHIGASGVVYALAAFHFTSGVIRRETRLMAFSLLVIFLYGSMVWGIFPEFFPERNISWESHLMGIVAGIVLAFAYRKSGPQVRVYEWPEEEEEDINETPYWVQNDTTTMPVEPDSSIPESEQPTDSKPEKKH